MTTLIREWGTRSGLQAVLQVGGQTNFGPSAEALLTQFDDAPQLIVIADGDGDPEAARQQITNDLIQRAAAAEVLVVEPILETSLGIFQADDCIGEVVRPEEGRYSPRTTGPSKTAATQPGNHQPLYLSRQRIHSRRGSRS